MNQELLSKLDLKYKEIEEDSLSIQFVPPDCFFCVRLDGIKATKNHLKEKLINKKFNKSFHEAIVQTFKAFNNSTNDKIKSKFVCLIALNDEVSFLFEKSNIGYDRRIMKLCTILSGILSSWFTWEMVTYSKAKGGHFHKKRIVMPFDSRPLILKSESDVMEYIKYRYLVGKRYAYWKTLRLADYPEVYEDHVKKNLDNAEHIVIDLNLEKKFYTIENTYTLFNINHESNLEQIVFNGDFFNKSSLYFYFQKTIDH